MSAISGFPSNQKVQLGTGITNNFATVVPTDPNRAAIEVPRFAFRVDDDAVPRTAGVGTGISRTDGIDLFWVADTATPARAGDFVRFEDGDAAYLEIPIVKVETNRFLLAVSTGLLPAASDTFFIMRYATQLVNESGAQQVTVTTAPIQYVLNGADTEVKEVTATPANSRPLPVKVLNSSGSPVIFDTGLVPYKYDEVVTTYVPSGNGVGEVATAVYKLATVTVATLTMTYDSSNRITNVVRT